MNARSSTLCHSLTLHAHSHLPTLQIYSSLRRPRRNSIRLIKPSKTPQYDQRLNFVIDLENIANRASNSFTTKLNRFISLGTEAFEDFQTLVTVDNNRRVTISCRRSSLWFLANSLILGFIIFAVFRVIFAKFGFLRYYHGGYGNVGFTRRDRSLGGREVVVGKSRFKEREGKKKGFKFSVNPLSLSKEMSRMGFEGAVQPRNLVSKQKELPQWWPAMVNSSSLQPSMETYQEFQKEANRQIRAIMDNRMCGKDITEDDILQFRRVCKASGSKVYIETDNVRDAFYRASVDFVLNSCISSANDSSVALIDGEDARQFVTGIADSIGLQNVRAATIVLAAVAARTKSWFLQAWALEMQGKRSEALTELSKICLIHKIFPPEESSAEMEMVARGLEKHLRVEQRKILLNLLAERCGTPCGSAAEALGLTINPASVVDDDDDRWGV